MLAHLWSYIGCVGKILSIYVGPRNPNSTLWLVFLDEVLGSLHKIWFKIVILIKNYMTLLFMIYH